MFLLILSLSFSNRYFLGSGNESIISVITAGEIRSIPLQNNWGLRKVKKLENLIHRLSVYPLNITDQIDRVYEDIEAFSQCRHPHLFLPSGLSARNMGKNDLWIAATTHILNATLNATDQDFGHLGGVFFPVEVLVF